MYKNNNITVVIIMQMQLLDYHGALPSDDHRQ